MSFSTGERGLGLIEYILILILVVIILLVLYKLFSPSITSMIDNLIRSTPTPTVTPSPF
jgi:hypothetical protein